MMNYSEGNETWMGLIQEKIERGLKEVTDFTKVGEFKEVNPDMAILRLTTLNLDGSDGTVYRVILEKM